MITSILAWLSSFIISIISATGYSGIFFLMALESACIPIPSEVVMPFSGYLVWEGRFEFVYVVLWGVLGNLAGSVLAYWAGYWGGRKLILKYGKYILLSSEDLELAENWFHKYGQSTVFFSRVLPVVRTFISLPAGIARMDFKKFCFYTLAGSLPWLWALAYVGVVMGENWEGIKVYFHKFDVAVGIILAAGLIWWISRHFLRKKKYE